MMQNFGLEDLSDVQSRRNLLKYLVRVEMASDWFTRIYRSILAEQLSPEKDKFPAFSHHVTTNTLSRHIIERAIFLSLLADCRRYFA